MLKREIWGPHLWYSIHFIALGYPNEASNIDKQNYKNFYINIPNIIPCEECSKHFIDSLNNYQIDNYLDNKNKLFEWTVIIHNEVNKLLGKKIWNLDNALNHYNNFNIKNNNNNNNIYFIVIFILIIILLILIKLLYFHNNKK